MVLLRSGVTSVEIQCLVSGCLIRLHHGAIPISQNRLDIGLRRKEIGGGCGGVACHRSGKKRKRSKSRKEVDSSS